VRLISVLYAPVFLRDYERSFDHENTRECEPRKNCCLTWYSSEESIVLEEIS
jgi:hypothetical protein